MKDNQNIRGAPFPLPIKRVFQTVRAIISIGEVLQYHTVVLANDFCSPISTDSTALYLALQGLPAIFPARFKPGHLNARLPTPF